MFKEQKEDHYCWNKGSKAGLVEDEVERKAGTLLAMVRIWDCIRVMKETTEDLYDVSVRMGEVVLQNKQI